MPALGHLILHLKHKMPFHRLLLGLTANALEDGPICWSHLEHCCKKVHFVSVSITPFSILGDLQFCWQVCRCVILAFNDLIAFIQSLENGEGVTDAVEGSQVFCK